MMASSRSDRRSAAAAFLFVLLLLGTVGCAGTNEAHTERPVAVRLAQVRQMDLAEAIDYLGTVHSGHEVLVTARVQGTLMQLPRNEGEAVQAGETVARISVPQLDATVARLKADEDYWSNRLAEDHRLRARGAIAQEQLQASVRAHAVASAALLEGETTRSWAVEEAPFTGVVLDWNAEPGQHVQPGQPLLLLGDRTREIRVSVVEEDLRRGIGLGTPVSVRQQGHEALSTEVSEVASVSGSRSRAFTVTVTCPPGFGGGLRNGESVPVRFLLRQGEGEAAVPVRSIVDRDSQPHVYVVREGRAQRWAVEIGVEEDGWVAIEPAPSPGALVAVSNQEELNDGASVFGVPDAEEKP